MRYWIETLGCPKNHVDSEKLSGLLETRGLPGGGLGRAGRARRGQHLRLHRGGARGVDRDGARPGRAQARRGARLVVTGCMAERYGDELAAALPEVDLVAGFGQSLDRADAGGAAAPARARLRPAQPAAPGERRGPGPTSRSPRAATGAAASARSRPSAATSARAASGEVLTEARALVAGGVKEIVLIAQDLASWGHDRRRAGRGEPVEALESGAAQPLIDLVGALAGEVERVRLLYLYPSGLTGGLIEAILATGVPYFDLSLQHVTRPLLRAHAPLGRRRALPRAHRGDPPRRSDGDLPLLVHPGLPGRDRGRPARAARVPRRGPARLGRASSPSRPRRARRRATWPTRWTRRWPSSGCAR